MKLLLQYCPQLQQEIPFLHSRKTKDNLLYLAVKAKHLELVQLIVPYFIQAKNVDEENPISGLTPFMLAALKNLQMIAKYLYFKCKANINYKNQFEETCMHIAKRKGM